MKEFKDRVAVVTGGASGIGRAMALRFAREDMKIVLADVEKAEIAVLSAYLPQQLSEVEVVKEIEAAIAETGASGAKEMGKVMGLLKSRLAGKTDMGKVSGLVKAKLSG